MPWQQSYTPLSGTLASALLAGIPVIVLLALLAQGRLRARHAALVGLASAIVLCIAVFRMPASLVFLSALYGASFGLFPIAWLVVNVLFLFDLAVASGTFEIIKRRILGLSDDPRIQVLLIAYGFGSFLEGIAGFGAPVAITGALMAGIGFSPKKAAVLALLGNTAPVAFGSIGIPLVTLASVTGLDLRALSAMVGTQLPLFALMIPFWLVALTDGTRGLRHTWPACLVMGLVFSLVQFWVSHAFGPWLVDLASGASSIVALVVLLRFWQPVSDKPLSRKTPEVRQERLFAAALPWILLAGLVSLWSYGPMKAFLDRHLSVDLPIAGLDKQVERMPPVVLAPTLEPAVIHLNYGSAAGSAILLGAVISGLSFGFSARRMSSLYLATIFRLREAIGTISTMMALGYLTRFAGADAMIGLAFASTGRFFPFFSPFLGWIGAALTGSDTSSNVLFGNVQQVAASKLGISPIITAAANSSGGVMGKMIDAQSIVVANSATAEMAAEAKADPGGPGQILRAVFWHSLALATLMGIFVAVQVWCAT